MKVTLNHGSIEDRVEIFNSRAFMAKSLIPWLTLTRTEQELLIHQLDIDSIHISNMQHNSE